MVDRLCSSSSSSATLFSIVGLKLPLPNELCFYLFALSRFEIVCAGTLFFSEPDKDSTVI